MTGQKLFGWMLAFSFLTVQAQAQSSSSSSTSFAPNTTSAKAPKIESESTQSGLTVGLVYNNISDLSVQTEGGDLPSVSNKLKGANVNLTGVNVGYETLSLNEFGYEVGASFLKSVDNSQFSSNSSFFQILGNVNYEMAPMWHAYAGANVGWMTVADENEKGVTPDLGGQLGIGFQNKGFQMSLGYTLLRFTRSYSLTVGDDSNVRTTKVALGGLGAKIGYLF